MTNENTYKKGHKKTKVFTEEKNLCTKNGSSIIDTEEIKLSKIIC